MISKSFKKFEQEQESQALKKSQMSGEPAKYAPQDWYPYHANKRDLDQIEEAR
jgi:hypothetical protein